MAQGTLGPCLSGGLGACSLPTSPGSSSDQPPEVPAGQGPLAPSPREPLGTRAPWRQKKPVRQGPEGLVRPAEPQYWPGGPREQAACRRCQPPALSRAGKQGPHQEARRGPPVREPLVLAPLPPSTTPLMGTGCPRLAHSPGGAQRLKAPNYSI